MCGVIATEHVAGRMGHPVGKWPNNWNVQHQVGGCLTNPSTHTNQTIQSLVLQATVKLVDTRLHVLHDCVLHMAKGNTVQTPTLR